MDISRSLFFCSSVFHHYLYICSHFRVRRDSPNLPGGETERERERGEAVPVIDISLWQKSTSEIPSATFETEQRRRRSAPDQGKFRPEFLWVRPGSAALTGRYLPQDLKERPTLFPNHPQHKSTLRSCHLHIKYKLGCGFPVSLEFPPLPG